MIVGKDRKTKKQACLNCMTVVDGATSVGSKDHAPKPGNVTVCIYCGHWMAYADDLSFRELSGAEMHRLAGDPRMLAISHAIDEARKKREQDQ